jgi:acetylornithine deacetylase/succinyl-diaminopimelate desuccinylase-like protein
MPAWSELLPRLTERPRENGTAAIQETAAWLAETLQGLGLDVTTVAYTAHPYRLRLAGIVALLGGALYAWCLRRRRPLAALGVAVVLPAVLLLELDRYVPLVSWIGATPQHHVVARLPAQQPTQRLVFAAHYDTKTDLLDHVERAPIELLGLPLTALMIAAAAWAARGRHRRGPLPRLARVASWAAVLYGVGLFASLSAGMLVPSRSPGALDDGASCALLVRLADRLRAAGPLPRTEVEIALLSGEEIGVHGSWELARQRFAAPPDLPTAVVNLEGLGATPDLAVFGSERFSLRSFPPDPRLVAILDAAHRQLRRKPLHVTWYGAATDARSFLAHGVPAATLTSDLPGHGIARGMHSAADAPDRLDPAALDASLAYLEAVARLADQRGLQ